MRDLVVKLARSGLKQNAGANSQTRISARKRHLSIFRGAFGEIQEATNLLDA